MNEKEQNRKSRKSARRLRWIVLASVLGLSTILGLMHQYWPESRVVGVDALCPFGGIEALYTLAASGSIMAKIATSSFILLVGVIVLALIARRSFCGQICPLGFMQEMFGKIGNIFFKRGKPSMPKILDKPARLIKYVLLAVIVFMTAYTSELWYRAYDPWATYHHLLSDELFTGFLIGFILLVVSLLGSIVYDRFFCRYVCPMGAFLAIMSPLSWLKVRRNTTTCIDCKACDKACPVSIKVSEKETVNSPECINCNECVTACPVKETLEVKGKNSKAVKPAVMTILALGVMVVVTGGSTAAGWFGWTTPTLAETVKKTGEFNPDDIKGKSTFKEISDVTKIPLSVFKTKFKLTDKDMTVELKTLEDKGASPDEVREFVEEYLKTGQAPAVNSDDEKSETPTAPAFDTAEIKGGTTVRETAAMSGVPLAKIQEKFSIGDGQVDTAVKDLKGIVGYAELDELRAYITDYLKSNQ